MGLFSGKKSTPTVEPRRTVRLEGGGRPDFVYYANRQASRTATTGKGDAPERSRSLLNAPVGVNRHSSSRQRKLLLWVLLVPSLLLLGQLILLNNQSRVVLLQPDGTKSAESAEIYENTVNDILASSILSRSKITIDTRGIAAELRRRHPEIESAVVTVPVVGGRPTAYVVQSEAVLTLQQGASYYTLSASGYITGAVTGELTLPLVQDETGEKVEVGKRLLPRSHVEFMRTVLYQFEQANSKVASFVLPANKAYEVALRLDGKPYIVRFNFEEDALQQSGAAIATIEQLGSTVPTTYLDVRVPGRVYYK